MIVSMLVRFLRRRDAAADQYNTQNFTEKSCGKKTNCRLCNIRVHTDLGKVWKVLEFNLDIFKE